MKTYKITYYLNGYKQKPEIVKALNKFQAIRELNCQFAGDISIISIREIN